MVLFSLSAASGQHVVFDQIHKLFVSWKLLHVSLSPIDDQLLMIRSCWSTHGSIDGCSVGEQWRRLLEVSLLFCFTASTFKIKRWTLLWMLLLWREERGQVCLFSVFIKKSQSDPERDWDSCQSSAHNITPARPIREQLQSTTVCVTSPSADQKFSWR